MAKQPNHWFPFYYEKFLIGVWDMSDREVGAYIRLLILQFDKGGISQTFPLLRKYRKVFEKFSKKDDGLYYNDRMLEVCLKQSDFNEIKAKRAKMGADARWGKMPEASPSIAQAMPNKVKESKEQYNIHIGEKFFNKKPSDIFKEDYPARLEIVQITLLKGIDIDIILNDFDTRFAAYNFKDENHFFNTLVMKKEKYLPVKKRILT